MRTGGWTRIPAPPDLGWPDDVREKSRNAAPHLPAPSDGKIAPYLEKYCFDYGIGMLLSAADSVQTAAET